MDILDLIKPFVTALALNSPLIALVTLIIVVKSVVRSNWFKGWIGERKVRRMLETSLNDEEYHLFHDVTLQGGEGTSQIDHVVVSPYGVFTVETKNYSGTIYSSERDAEWTRFRGGSKIKIKNPLLQAYSHKMSLVDLLGTPPNQVFEVVALVGTAQLKKAMPEKVTQGDGCVRYIKSHTGRLMSPEEAERLAARIEALRMAPGRATRRIHRASLDQRHKERR